MIDLFSKKRKTSSIFPLEVDVHSHLLPGIDDGVESFDEAIEIIQLMKGLGYKKLITTPHIMSEFYPNNKEIILDKLEGLKTAMSKVNLEMEIEAAAEYYLDESFLALLDTPEKLLVFGKKYLLFETSFINEPVFLKEAIFKINSIGLQPVLAHPERYMYIQTNFSLLEEFAERNLLYQCNINAIEGYYSGAAKSVAKKMIKNNMVSFLGSDCHNMKHAFIIKKAISHKYFQKAIDQDLKNNTL